jgi:hypothetical protein
MLCVRVSFVPCVHTPYLYPPHLFQGVSLRSKDFTGRFRGYRYHCITYYIYRYRYSCVQVYTRVQLPHAREKIVTLRKKWKIYKKRNPKFDTWMAAQKARTATGQWYAEMRRKMGIRGRGRVPVRDAGQVGGGRGRDDRGSHQLVTSSVRSVATCICTLYLFVFLGVFAGEFMFMSS